MKWTHFVVCSYLEKNLIFFSPLWEDWWIHGIRVYNHIPPVELLWCGLLFLWGSLPRRIPQQQLCAGCAEQRLRWCVLKLCIHTRRWPDTQTWPCTWLCFAVTLMYHSDNIPHTWLLLLYFIIFYIILLFHYQCVLQFSLADVSPCFPD